MSVGDRFNADLVDDLARQRVVLFLGSGVSASAKTRTGRRIRTWEAFLREANKSVAKPLRSLVSEQIRQRDYLVACELIRRGLDNNVWIEMLKKEYLQTAEPSTLHEAIVGLDQRIVLTTNFDKLLESAFDKLDASPQVITSLDDGAFRCLRDSTGRYLVKLHGTVDRPDEMVFTKSDYVGRALGNWAYGELLRALLLSYTFLFIGFSMTDPAVAHILETYAQRFAAARPHYILLANPVATEIFELNRSIRGLYIIQYDGSGDHARLPQLLKALAETMRRRRREIVAQSSNR